MNDKDKDMEYNYGANIDEEEVEVKKKKYTKSFYVVFALCLCAIGVAGWYTYADVSNYMNDSKKPDLAITSSEPKNKQAEAKVDGVEKTTEKETESQTEEDTTSSTQPSATESTQPKEDTKKVSPVGNSKEVTLGYSGDKLIYFETLKDWRVHKGADYAIEKGKEVYSISNGTVTSVFTDNLYGDGVEIEYNSGFTAVYYGVKVSEGVSTGTTLNAGDKLGTASGVPCEQNVKEHIHLEIKKDGRYVNPETYLNISE